MKTDLHLVFPGTCREAFAFYEKTFNAKIQFSMTFGEAPAGAPVPSDANELIMHTSMNHSCGPGTLTIQPTPNLSVHMPNRGDQKVGPRTIWTVPPALSSSKILSTSSAVSGLTEI